jgi:hypothetical protein
MPTHYLDIDNITEARRKAIKASIKTITFDELKSLGEELFPLMDNPWREKYLQFINENAGSTFHHATTNDRIQIVYCHAKDNGMWFVPGSAMGPLQAKGRGILKEIVEKT